MPIWRLSKNKCQSRDCVAQVLNLEIVLKYEFLLIACINENYFVQEVEVNGALWGCSAVHMSGDIEEGEKQETVQPVHCRPTTWHSRTIIQK